MNKWQILLDYKFTVVKKNLEDNLLKCPDCNLVYTTRLGEDDDPLLVCFYCQTKVNPGLNWYESLKEVIKRERVE